MTYRASKASHEQTERDSEIGTDDQPTMPEDCKHQNPLEEVGSNPKARQPQALAVACNEP